MKKEGASKIVLKKHVNKPATFQVKTFPIPQSQKPNPGQKSQQPSKRKARGKVASTSVAEIFKEELANSLKKKCTQDAVKTLPDTATADIPSVKEDTPPKKVTPPKEPPVIQELPTVSTKKPISKSPVRKLNLKTLRPTPISFRQPVVPRDTRAYGDYIHRGRFQPPKNRYPFSSYRLGEERIPISLGDHQTEIIAVPLRSKDTKHVSKKARNNRCTPGSTTLSAVEKYQPFATDSEESSQSSEKIDESLKSTSSESIINERISSPKQFKALTSFWNKKILQANNSGRSRNKRQNQTPSPKANSKTESECTDETVKEDVNVKTPETPPKPSDSVKEQNSNEVEKEPPHVNINDVLSTLESLQHFITSSPASSKDNSASQDIAHKIFELMKAMGKKDASWEKQVFLTPASRKIMGHTTTQFIASVVFYVSGPYDVYEEHVSIGNSLAHILDCSSNRSYDRGNFGKNYGLDEESLYQRNNWVTDQKLRSNFIVMTCFSSRSNLEFPKTFEVEKQNPNSLLKYLTSPVHLAPANAAEIKADIEEIQEQVLSKVMDLRTVEDTLEHPHDDEFAEEDTFHYEFTENEGGGEERDADDTRDAKIAANAGKCSSFKEVIRLCWPDELTRTIWDLTLHVVMYLFVARLIINNIP